MNHTNTNHTPHHQGTEMEPTTQLQHGAGGYRDMLERIANDDHHT